MFDGDLKLKLIKESLRKTPSVKFNNWCIRFIKGSKIGIILLREVRIL